MEYTKKIREVLICRHFIILMQTKVILGMHHLSVTNLVGCSVRVLPNKHVFSCNMNDVKL